MTHVMVDLETWGTAPGSALRSIGAVVFDPATGETGAEFYANLDDASCEAWGLTKNPATVAWWDDQSPEARDAFKEGAQHLDGALYRFAAWWAEQDADSFWAYGPNFDEVLLAAAYRACSIVPPWTYKQPRCVRTILALAGVEIPRTSGVHHNALDDAKNQVTALREAFARLGLASAEAQQGRTGGGECSGNTPS